jgi:general secretion pathway protein M
MKAFLVQLDNQWQESTAPLRKRWVQLAPRERLSVTVLGVCVLLTILVFGIWMPSHRAAEKARMAHDSNRELLLWMKANADRARSVPSASGESVLGAVNGAAGTVGLALSRIEPEGDQAVRVWVERGDFNTVAKWLAQLSASGIVATEAQVEKQATGGVSGRFTLSR